MRYVLTIGHRVCLLENNDVCLVNEIERGTVFSTIGSAFKKAADIMSDLGETVFVKRLG